LKNTNINNFNIINNIFIADTKDKLYELKELFENSNGKFYRYGMYKDISGYYYGIDFKDNSNIYCASLKLSEAVGLMNKHISKQEKND
jgi:hypothetical protein